MRLLFCLPLVLAVGCLKPYDTDPQYIVCFDLGDMDTRFSTLQDAVDAAVPGDTVFFCDAVITEGATIDKPLILDGAGKDDTVLRVTGEQAALNIRDTDGVIVRGMTLGSMGGPGLLLDNASVSIDNVKISGVGTYAIDAHESAIVMEDTTIGESELGGVKLDDGSIDISNSRFFGINSFGLSLDNGADGVVTDSTFGNIYYTNDAGYLFEADGTAIVTNHLATLSTARNVFDSISVAAIQTESTSLTMDGDTLGAAFVGLLTLDTDAVLNNVTITGAVGYAGYMRTTVLDATNLVLTAPEGNEAGAMGLYAPGSMVTLRGGTVSRFGTGGVYVPSISPSDPVALTMTGTVVDDSGEIGVAVVGGSLTATDVSVSGLTDPNGVCVDPVDGDVCNFAVYVREGAAAWSGGSVSNNTGSGFVLDTARLDASDVLLDSNQRSTFIAISSAIKLERGVLTAIGEAGFDLLESDAAIIDTTFTGARFDATRTQEDGGSLVYFDAARDVRLVGGSVSIDGGTHTDGQWGIEATDADVSVSNSTFSQYTGGLFSISGGTLTVLRLDADALATPAIACEAGLVDAERLTIQGVSVREDRVDAYDSLGTLVVSDTTVFRSPAIDADHCTVYLDKTTLTSASVPPIQTRDGVIEWSNVQVFGGASAATDTAAAVDVAFTTDTPRFIAEGVTVSGTSVGAGFSISGASGLEPGFVQLTDISLGVDDGAGHQGIPGDGLRISGVDATLSGVDVRSAGGDCIEVDGGSLVVSGDDGARDGILGECGGVGVRVIDGNVDLSALVVRAAGGDGLHLVGGTHALRGFVVESSSAYGMRCDLTDIPLFSDCDVTLTGALGESEGCISCPVE